MNLFGVRRRGAYTLYRLIGCLSLALLVACGSEAELDATPTYIDPLSVTNLIQNGSFDDGQEGWSVLASSDVTYADNGVDEYGRYCVWVGDGGGESFDIYLYQDGLQLEAGTTYTLRFSALTGVGETAQFSVKVGGSSGDFTPYSVSTYEVAGGEAQAQEVSFEMSEDAAAQLEFQLGGRSETQYFCFDDVSLVADSEATPTEPTPEFKSLRDLAEARGILIGAALQADPLRNEEAYAEIAAGEFNLLSPEGSFLISEMHTPDDPYRLSGDLTDLDYMVDFALDNDAEVQAFHLVWFLEASWAPWLNETLPTDKRRKFIRRRVQDVMARYGGKVNTFNVVNEAFEKDGSLRGATTDGITNWLYEANPKEPYGYIEYSFKQARRYNPDATLLYNDYGLEYGGPKWDAVLRMVKDFKARGIPIDGVGFQGHLNMKWGPLPPASGLAEHMRQLEELGLEAHITEFDIGIETGDNDAYAGFTEAERLAIQARYYGDYLEVCLEAPNCTTFAMWGLTDKYSWITQEQWGGSPAAKPLPYNVNYEPKAAYGALQETLSE